MPNIYYFFRDRVTKISVFIDIGIFFKYNLSNEKFCEVYYE